MEYVYFLIVFSMPFVLIYLSIFREANRENNSKIQYKEYYSDEWHTLTEYSRQEAWNMGEYFDKKKPPWYVRVFKK